MRRQVTDTAIKPNHLSPVSELSKLQDAVIAFRDTRDWEQFHTLKNLAAGLAIEAGELQELLLWKTDVQAEQFVAGQGREAFEEELADCMIFILYLAKSQGIDLSEAVLSKLKKNEAKYPAEQARGRSDKYTAYQDDKS